MAEPMVATGVTAGIERGVLCGSGREHFGSHVRGEAMSPFSMGRDR